MTPLEEAIALLVAAYPVPSWEPVTLRLYANQVEPFGPLIARQAVIEWLQAQPERPSIAELRTACIGLQKRALRDARRARELAQIEADSKLIEGEVEPDIDIGKLLRDTVRKIGGAK